jgi:S-adenosylmethionine-dependent methyltransferase
VSSGQRVEQRDDLRGESRTDAGRGGQIDELLIAALGPGAASATALDCGGGTGRFAVPLAAAGVTVTVLDVSADALATLRRRASEAGVAERVRAVQGDVESLHDPESLEALDVFGASGATEATGTLAAHRRGEGAGQSLARSSFDLVLAHGILDAVEVLPATFRGIAAMVRPGGLLSILVNNPVAAAIARVLAGDLSGAEREIAALDDDVTSSPAGRRAAPDTVLRLCAEHGLVVEQQHGIGIFRDLVPGQALDAPGARDALARLESACAQRTPFAQIAGRVHILARRGDQG